MSKKDLKHICGACTKGFATEQEYIDHTCEKTGATPASFEHQEATGNAMGAISEASLKRGLERSE